MSTKSKIPRPTVKRLSLYLRQLEAMAASDQTTTNSKNLGQALGLTDAQVRKDLAFFGQFGHPGIGYKVSELIAQLRKILGTDRSWNTAIVGAGNIGRALMAYGRFKAKGFEIVAVFDANPQVVGSIIENHKVRPMKDLAKLIKERDIKLGILTVPGEVAQEVTDQLIDAGVKGILNFAPVRLDVRDAVSVNSVDFSVSLEQLAFQVSLGVKGSLDEQEA